MHIHGHDPLNHPLHLRRLGRLGLTIALALAACGDSQGDTHESHGESTTAATGTTDGGTAATTTTDASTAAASTTHDTHDTHGESTTDASTTTAPSTTHDHSTTDATTHDTHDTHDTDATTGGGDAEGYCACMLVNCHDQYHATWGEDHEASEMKCIAEAEALDAAAFTCRMTACDAAADDPATCVDALGGGACM